MDKFLSSLVLVAATAAFAAPASAAGTSPVGAATPATATAQIVDPLSLKATQNLNFGTLIKVNGMASSHVVSIDEADTVACTPELLCGGTTKSAKFDVFGSANQVVKVYVAPTTMNGPSGATLAFTPTAASTSPLTLSNSGAASFAVGGSITVAPTTVSGVYVGDMDVTVDYN